MANPIANPMVVYREELDDWSVLFDPDTGNTYGLDPIGSFIWKKFDGKHNLQDIINKLSSECGNNLPNDVFHDLDEFLNELKEKGLIGYEE